jgi:hypothetical protein
MNVVHAFDFVINFKFWIFEKIKEPFLPIISNIQRTLGVHEQTKKITIVL